MPPRQTRRAIKSSAASEIMAVVNEANFDNSPVAGRPVSPVSPVEVARAVSGLNEIIDLTQDSPSNTYLRSPRSRNQDRDRENDVVLLDDIAEFTSNISRRRIIESVFDSANTRTISDETIFIDDTSSASDTESQEPAVIDSYTGAPRILSCPICLEPLKSELEPMITPCGHMFCNHCLKSVGQNQKKCSICQLPLKLKKCIKVHYS